MTKNIELIVGLVAKLRSLALPFITFSKADKNPTEMSSD